MSNWNFKKASQFVVILSCLLISCTKKDANTNSKEINLSIWSNYISEPVAREFTASTGIKLNISNYSSNEELLAKLQSGGGGADLIVPSDYMVQIMIKQGLLEKLDPSQIPNAKNVDSQWLAQTYDPNNEYSLPYAWTTTGIAINKELYKGSIKSWKDLFSAKDLVGKVSLLDDVREVAGASLKSIGKSLNSVEPKDLQQAEKVLMQFRSQVKMFHTDVLDALKNKEIAVAQAYSGDALRASSETKGQVIYIIPTDGCTLSIDNMAIPKKAKNKANALALINFLLKTETNLNFVKNNRGGPVVAGVRDLLPDDLKNHEALFPKEALRVKLEKIQDLGENTKLYDKLWTNVKSE